MLVNIIDKGSPPAIQSLTDILSDLHTRRALDVLAREIGARARDTSDGAGEQILADFERSAAEIAQSTSVDTAWLQADDMIAEAIATARLRNGEISLQDSGPQPLTPLLQQIQLLPVPRRPWPLLLRDCVN